MLYLLVQVNEAVKYIIPERIMSIKSTCKFFELFDLTTLGQYDEREVKVFIRQEKSEGWREVDNGLDGDLKMLEVLDAFSILMSNSIQPLLPCHCNEHNNYNRLYNKIIELFKVQQVEWTGGLHETIEKVFINRLATTLWYIDPHFSTLSARLYYLPPLFAQLKTYQDKSLSQQKLAHLSSSFEISISQPWASSNRWNQVIPAVLSLIEILKKYSDYLIATIASMNELHHSNESARISACEPHQLKDEYVQLDNLLSEKSFYKHIEIQQYLSDNAIN
ncbi:6164_t:CDS:2 [Gigaspora margarita]|uniref:6164_t:CDS:1 n=1 Tax=Gigaspora margarita TaxID=4874 RepID=A0ABN7VY21_GIGMA|nr:6164_t:CDS:2 [Gigaspora margarita]